MTVGSGGGSWAAQRVPLESANHQGRSRATRIQRRTKSVLSPVARAQVPEDDQVPEKHPERQMPPDILERFREEKRRFPFIKAAPIEREQEQANHAGGC